MITIIDYGLGNLCSVHNMMKKIGVPSEITSDLLTIEKATKLLLPGVGAFDAAMEKLTNTDLRLILDQKVLVEKIPVLGICLGMQLMAQGSEEGILPGLGWISAHVHQFPKNELKVPHMGWNVANRKNESLLTKDFEEEHRYYFLHAYYVKVDNEDQSILQTQYGLTFDSGIQQENIYGVQFHPEKSHRFGMRLFQNFASL